MWSFFGRTLRFEGRWEDLLIKVRFLRILWLESIDNIQLELILTKSNYKNSVWVSLIMILESSIKS